MNQAFGKRDTNNTDIAIVGAGPYGLSIAAHLNMAGCDCRTIGFPMKFWAEQMPKGMLLKSEGFASNLYDPKGSFTLRSFCEGQGIEYADVGVPVHLETFSAYGLSFQKRFVPSLENKALLSLRRSSRSFLLELDDGESFAARTVVMATGLSHFQYIPTELAHLPSEFMSHSSAHNELERFRGRELAVIGGGASASDLATLLHECGAAVHLIARRPSIQFHDKMTLPRPLWKRIRYPMSTIGPGWRSLVYADAPLLFRCLPEATRLRTVASHLGPAGGWFMRDRFAKVPHLLGYHVKRADVSHSRVHLQLLTDDGVERELSVDHVVAATGYRVDVNRLPFLTEEIRSQLKLVSDAPVLSSTFESSVPGLYFVGAVAANSFGPVMRFAAGAKFTARKISKCFAQTLPDADKLRSEPISVTNT